MQKTYIPKFDNKRSWVLFDAQDKTLGKLAVQIANYLRGKNRADYTSFIVTGSNVVVINSDKVFLSGQKEEKKEYNYYSGYMGGRKVANVKQVRAKDSTRLIYYAVKGMLPKNKLNKNLLSKLHIYKDDKHPHTAQKPKKVN